MRFENDHVWTFMPATDSYNYYEIPVMPGDAPGDPIVSLSRRQYRELKDWMVDNDPHGVIRTDRKEDLKLIHRLVDIIEKKEKA